MPRLILYAYWRSSASYRVRIALNLKGLEYEIRPINLVMGEHNSTSYRALTGQGLVPALFVGRALLTQSVAIMEYVEEIFPDRGLPLLPHYYDSLHRAFVRQIVQMIACDIHPLQNLRVKKALAVHNGHLDMLPHERVAAMEADWHDWSKKWIASGFQAIERQLISEKGSFCLGDQPTMADCCLVPQVYNAMRFGVDLEPFWRIRGVYETCMKHSAFQKAAPENQPDAPKT